MISVPLYLLVGQAVLLLVACVVLASAYRRLGRPADGHQHGAPDEASGLVGTPLPDLGPMTPLDGSGGGDAPRRPGPGEDVLLVYVLPGCETCQTALERLAGTLADVRPAPRVHVVAVGGSGSADGYRRFGAPVWRADRTLADIFGLKAYPVFLAVDQAGMIRAAGSAHDHDALRAYAGVVPVEGPGRTSQPIHLTPKP